MIKRYILSLAIFYSAHTFAQNVGIGEASPASKFSVKGNLSIGNGYSGIAAPANGAIIEGNVGIGNTTAPARLYLKGDGANPIVTAVDNTDVVKVYVSPTGNVGINTNTPGTALDVRTTDAVKMPSGTTAERPASPLAGTTRFNTDCSCLEYYDGTQWVSANTTQVPVGTIAPYAGTTAPSGWLMCDGSAVSRTTYALLFSIIGTTYGAGDGSTTFNLPDLRGRTTFGLTGAAPFSTLGTTGGSLSQTPTINTSGLSVDIAPTSTTLPNHVHTVPAHSHGFSLNTAANTTGNESGHTHSWGGWWSTDNAGSVAFPTFGDGAGNTFSDGYVGYWNNNFPTSSNGDHSHNLTFQNDDYNGSGGGNRWGLEDDAGSFYDRATSTTGNHSHNVYLPNHRHWIQARNTSGGSAHNHSIPSLSVSGTVGTGSSADGGTLNTGNNTTSPAISIDPASTAISGSATSSAVNVTNPYQVTNYIIKATNTASASIVAANIPTGTFGQTLYFNTGWTPTNNLYNNGTNVGVGTSSPTVLFDVDGNARVRSLSTGVVKSDVSGNLSSSLITNADVNDVAWSKVTGKPTTLSGYGITDAAPLSGGANYIQNTTSQQASSNFNISGNGTVGGILNTANVTTTGNSLNLSGAGWGMNFIIDADNNSNDNYIFSGNGAEIMRLSDAGNLGIGSPSPSYKLTIGGTGSIFGVDNQATFVARNSGGSYETFFWPRWSDNVMYMNFGSGGFRLRNNSSSDAIAIDNSNNVGIPSITGYKLTVGGDVYANGGWFRVSGNQGLYWETHGVGWYAQDGTWNRTYNNSGVYTGTGNLRTDGGFQMYTASPTMYLWDSDENTNYFLHVNNDRLYFLRGTGAFSGFDGNRPITIYQGNKVGINNATPGFPLHVSGTGSNTFNYSFLAYNNNGHGPCNGCGGNLYGIWADNRIAASEFNAFSDARIKVVLGRSNGEADLNLLKRIKVTDYEYIDKVAKGYGPKKGVIAQEIEEIIPEAVSMQAEFLPNIFSVGTSAKHQNVYMITCVKAHQLSKGDYVKVITGNESLSLKVANVIDDKTFEVNSEIELQENLFVYGKKVEDYRVVDYDRLFTTNISATQELARRIEVLEKQKADLLKSNNQLSSDVKNLKAQIDLINQQLHIKTENK